MTDLASVLADAKVHELQKVVSNGRLKYLCFTKCKDSKSWVINVTDGLDLWSLDLDEDGLEAQRDLSGVDSVDAFLARVRTGFQAGDVTVGRVGTKVTISIGKGGSVIDLDLFEAKAAEKKLELQSILFRLADSCSQLEDGLVAAKQQIDTLKTQKASGAGVVFNMSPKKGAGQAKANARKVGMSVINPLSRKRKTATGVVFEGN